MIDLIIKNGIVIDGSGTQGIKTNIAIDNGTIVDIGQLEGVGSRKLIEATGMIVCPGFIDIHSHSDFTILVDPRAQSALSQGVTTELIGNCGHGCAPITKSDRYISNIYGYNPLIEIDWKTTAEYMNKVETASPAINIATLVPNGNLRLTAMRYPDQQATKDEVDQMAYLLEEGLEAGAYGYSNGLEYPLESSVSEEEVFQLCNLVAKSNALYATHERNKDIRAVEAIEEGIRVAKKTDVRLQISHIIPRHGSPPASLEKIIKLVDEARQSTLDVSFDAHTRLHGILNASAALPQWAISGTKEDIQKNLKDPMSRDKIKSHVSIVSNLSIVGWDRMYLFSSWAKPGLVGKSFEELADSGQDPFDVLLDILMFEVEDLHKSLIICRAYEEDWLRQTFLHPQCALESDATTLCPNGPLSETQFLGAYTWAAWFFRRFVTEKKDFTLEQAIHKLTYLPAERIGLKNRGLLQKGAWADIVVLDPENFRENGTLDNPNKLASGVLHVLVNGSISIEDSKFTGIRNGQMLRR